MYGGALYDEKTIAVKDSLTYVSKSLRARSYASHPLESQLASGDERGIFSPTVRFDIHSCTLGFLARYPLAPSLPCLNDQEDASWRALMELGTTLMGKKVTMSYLPFFARDTNTDIRTRTRKQQ